MTTSCLTLSVLQKVFAVCRFDSNEPIPAWGLRGFFSVTRTEEELSIVCPQINVPPEVQASNVEGDWRCFKVEGPLDFALTGILAAIAVPLEEADISIFAISTYDTDYVLVKQRDLGRAMHVLSHAGHQVTQAIDQAAS